MTGQGIDLATGSPLIVSNLGIAPPTSILMLGAGTDKQNGCSQAPFQEAMRCPGSLSDSVPGDLRYRVLYNL